MMTTTTTNHCDELSARFSRMADEHGLVDVKFFLDTSDRATKSVVCGEVTRLFDAVDSGARYVLDFKDGSRQ